MGKFYSALRLFFLLSPFLFGLFFPWTAALASVFLLFCLCLLNRRDGVALSLSPLLIAAAAVPLSLLMAALWAVDHGMALIGFVQFLPFPLFVLCLYQLSPQNRCELLELLPASGVLMTVFSVLLSHIPLLNRFFMVNGRLAGFFQYPNTFALWLLLAIIVLLYRQKINLWLLSILLLGIFLSGSRSVFVLLFLLFLFYILSGKRWILLFPVLLVPVLLYFFSARFRSISFTASELLGRLLYARDALPVIFRHPFGLGYAGYSWLQGSFQTGVYSVFHIHNDFLQVLLDIGWIPAGLCIWALISGFRKTDFSGRLLLLFLCFHTLFDFDMQYPAVAMIALTVLSSCSNVSKKRWALLAPLSVCLVMLSLWLGISSFMLWFRNPVLASRLYSGYTLALVQQLPDTPAEEQEEIAERILALNDSVALAHDAKAHAAFARGDTLTMIEHKQEAIRLAKYNLDEYLDYLDLLDYARQLYLQAGDSESAALCTALIQNVPEQLQAVDSGTSSLGRRIRDLPDLQLPASYQSVLEKKA